MTHPDDLNDAERADLLATLRHERDGSVRHTGRGTTVAERWRHEHQPLSRTDRPWGPP